MFFEYDKQAVVSMGEGVSRKVLAHGGTVMGVEVSFDEGAVGARHNHPHEQMTYILEGDFEFIIEETQHIAKKGDTFYIPSDVFHQAICLKKGKLLDVFSPIREDFLK